jgi:uncharacterized linocin/CFP29 family protein
MNANTVEIGKKFWGGSSGRWAGEQMMKALANGGKISPQVLRTLSTLRKDEWKAYDAALVEVATRRLRAVADLIAAGLTKPLANAMGKTVYEFETVGDMNDAQISMDGVSQTENDRQTFDIDSIPVPITHKDFWINLRTLSASRERGESLDTTQVRTAGRLVAEAQENLLINGFTGKFGAKALYGYRTHPDRNTSVFGTNGHWGQAAKTGENMLADLLTCIAGLEADRMYGPYAVYVPRDASVNLEKDFKAGTNGSIRKRLLEVENVTSIRTVDFLASDNLLVVQLTEDVVQLVQGEPLQTIQWDVQGGFNINFKAFMIQVPLIRSDADGRSGIFHMSGS